MPRTSNPELPSETELWEILAKESQRTAVRYDYLNLHSNIFVAFEELCRKYDINFDWINTYERATLAELDAQIHICFNTLEQHILGQTGLLYERVYESLAASEAPAKADAIFVFGSPNDVRIKKAVELYKAGLAGKIVISGHGPFYASHTESEAQRMAQVAINEGVPRSVLMLESRAITLPDNVKRSLDLFEEIEFQPSKLIIVASAFALRRCVMDWYKFTPWNIEIIPVASDALSYDLTREGWTTTARGVRVTLNEYAKLIFETKMDVLRRDSIK